MSKKRTPIEEMTREQLVQSAAQYKNLYNKANAKVQEMAANYARLYKSLQSEKDCRTKSENVATELRTELNALKEKYEDLQMYLEDANREKTHLSAETVTQKDRIQRIKADIENYNALPWWKRIFKKMHTSE